LKKIATKGKKNYKGRENNKVIGTFLGTKIN